VVNGYKFVKQKAIYFTILDSLVLKVFYSISPSVLPTQICTQIHLDFSTNTCEAVVIHLQSQDSFVSYLPCLLSSLFRSSSLHLVILLVKLHRQASMIEVGARDTNIVKVTAVLAVTAS